MRRLTEFAAALVFAGCDQIDGRLSGGTGTVIIGLHTEGLDIDKISELNGAKVLRTVFPTIGDNTFNKYVLSFDREGTDIDPADVEISQGSGGTFPLPAGTYTITAKAVKTVSQTNTIVATGSVENVIIVQDQTAQASIILGPVYGGTTGTFSYSIDLTGLSGLNGGKGQLVITQGATPVTTRDLAENTSNTGNVDLSPGYYHVRVSLTKGSISTGFGPEIIHIYTGLLSTLPAMTSNDFYFTDSPTPPPDIVVSNFNLSNLFAASVAGGMPATTISAAQYTGTIAWSPNDATFQAGTVYTATVTLTATAGYTFTRLGQDAFTYTGATSVTNAADSGTVTVVFAATGGGTGMGWSLGTIGGYWIRTVEHKASYTIKGNAFGSWTEPGIVWFQEDLNGNGVADEVWYELNAGTGTERSPVTRRYSVTFFKLSDESGSGYGGQVLRDIYWADCKGRTGKIPGGWPHAYDAPNYNGARVTYTCTLVSDDGDINKDGLAFTLPSDGGPFVDHYGEEFPIDRAIAADGSPVTLSNVRFVKVHTGVFKYGDSSFGEISTEIEMSSRW